MSLIGILSDTHDNVPVIEKAAKIFIEKKVDKVIHLGDIIAPISLQFFEGLPITFIKGNNDGDVERLKKRCQEIQAEWAGISLEFTSDGKTFFCCHGDDPRVVEGAINSKKFDYVLYGHTHVTRDEHSGTTHVINPGALYFTVQDKTVALLDPENDELTFISV